MKRRFVYDTKRTKATGSLTRSVMAAFAIVAAIVVFSQVQDSSATSRLRGNRVRIVAPAPVPVLPATAAAFPGAVGYGANALQTCRDSVVNGSWGVTIWHVTTLDSVGDGSLKAVLEDSVTTDTYQFVVFDSSGHIPQETIIEATGNSCLYVAGQRAATPVVLSENKIRMREQNDNLVIRYLTWRKMDTGLEIEDGDDVILDHNSCSWVGSFGGQGCFPIDIDSTSRAGTEIRRMTISNNLCAQPNTDHPTCAFVSFGPGDEAPGDSVSFWRNLFMGPGHRLPQFNGWRVIVAQNLTYNGTDRHIEPVGEVTAMILSNRVKLGPSTSATTYKRFGSQLADECSSPDKGSDCPFSVYYQGNQYSESSTPYATLTIDEQYGRNNAADTFVVCYIQDEGHCPTNGDTLPDSIYSTTPTFSLLAAFPEDTVAMTNALADSILANVGASKVLSCGGYLVNARSATDSVFITEYNDSTGESTYIEMDTMTVTATAGAWTCTDADGDGMPAEFEGRFVELSDGDATDADDISRDGSYLWIEHFINGTTPAGTPPSVMNAYPGAVGFGATALWGSGDTATAARACVQAGLRVHVVTSVSATGPGTLDSIVSNELRDDTVDVVAWGVAGEVTSETTLSNTSCVVYAPWTAPAPGVTFDKRVEIRGDTSSTHDQVFLGWKCSPDSGTMETCIQQVAGKRIMWDYFTVRGFENDGVEGFFDTATSGVSLPFEYMTFAHFLVGPVITGGRGIGWRGRNANLSERNMRWLDMTHGFITSNQNRCPKIEGGDFTGIVDTVGVVARNLAMYNCDFQGAHSTDTSYIDWRDMCLVIGPMGNAGHFVMIDSLDGTEDFQQSHIYIDGVDTASAGGSNPCSGGAPSGQWDIITEFDGTPMDSTVWGKDRTGPMDDPTFSPGRILSEDIWPTLVRHAGTLGTVASVTDTAVGAAFRISCYGDRIWARGDIDSTMIAQALNNTGISSQNTVRTAYGPDDTNQGTSSACNDTDGDGLPDSVEMRINGLTDSTSATPDGDPDGDLYPTGIEYAAGSDPSVFTATNGLEGESGGATYGAPSYIYRSPGIVTDTQYADADGNRPPQGDTVDTIVILTWDADSIPAGGIGLSCWDGDTVRYFVSETSLSGGNLLDSSSADAFFPVGLCDTALVKDTSRIPN